MCRERISRSRSGTVETVAFTSLRLKRRFDTEAWIEFGRGPLFRLCFALLVLGLIRILALTWAGIFDVYRHSPDKILPWKEITKKTLAWLIPVRKLWTARPVYSAISFLFHLGLILTPLFLASHNLLWQKGVGFSLPSLPQRVANILTLLVVGAALSIFFGRVLYPAARAISRAQDYLWPLLLAVPFATGYVASNPVISPRTYELMMLLHVYAGDLILVMIPFTKLAHCVLAPLSQLVTHLAWKFPAGAGDRVAETLGYAAMPTWLPQARLRARPEAPNPEQGQVIQK